MTELKPCPFCGGEAKTGIDNDAGRFRAFAYCTKCGARVEYKPEGFKRLREMVEEVAEIWNKRVGEQND